jgi:biotin transport system substrate-specific component
MLTHAKYQPTVLLGNSLMTNALVVLLASAVLAAISQIAVPWQPVPLTFQSAMVVLLGLTLGARRAAMAVALYLLEGALGMPVFAEWHAGIAVFSMPSGGYLMGFLPAAFLTGWMMERGMARSFMRIFATALLGAMIIFLFGTWHLAASFGWKNAIAWGVMPFVIVEPVKLLIASYCVKNTWRQQKTLP